MKTKLALGLLATGLVFGGLATGSALANEGTLNLRGNSGESCYFASIYVDGNYQVLGTCRDLKMAITPEKNRYVLWRAGEKNTVYRMGEVVNGKFQGSTPDKFDRMFISLETSNYVNKPSTDIILTGVMSPINFGSGASEAQILATPTPTPTQEVKNPGTTKVNENGIVTNVPETGTGLGSLLGGVFKVILLGFGVLLLIVGIFSFISRRRSL